MDKSGFELRMTAGVELNGATAAFGPDHALTDITKLSLRVHSTMAAVSGSSGLMLTSDSHIYISNFTNLSINKDTVKEYSQ